MDIKKAVEWDMSENKKSNIKDGSSENDSTKRLPDEDK